MSEKMFLFLKAAGRRNEGRFEKARIDLAELLLKLPDVLDGLEDDLQLVDARLLREGRHDRAEGLELAIGLGLLLQRLRLLSRREGLHL